MTTWPVNFIEQDQVYQRLLDQYEQLQAQATPVLIQSFSEPTQEQWEDAYTRQTGRVAPILPGELRWLDLRNGSVKSYSTIYKDDGVSVDGTVRPIVDRNQAWGCWRLLGTSHIVNDLNFPLDTTTWINKGLVMLVLHVQGRNPTPFENQPVLGPTADFLGYFIERVAGAAPSASFSGGIMRYSRTLHIFNPSSQRIGNELVARISAVSAFGQGQYNTSTLRLSVGVNTLAAGPDITKVASSNARLKLYGLFASDPGYVEEFEIV